MLYVLYVALALQIGSDWIRLDQIGPTLGPICDSVDTKRGSSDAGDVVGRVAVFEK
jgi:hypothetical protein